MKMFCRRLLVFAIFIASSVSGRNNRRPTAENYRFPSNGTIVFPDQLEFVKNQARHSHHNVNRQRNASNEIPLDVARRLNEVDNIDEIILEYSSADEDSLAYTDVGIGTRFGNQRITGSVPIAKSAACIPEMTVVDLVPKNIQDPNLFYLPMCTRVLRCGGCCNNNLLKCEALETIEKSFRIYELNRLKKTSSKRLIEVKVEEHSKCTCACKIKEKDCNDKQTYFANQCGCFCNDMNAELNCNNNSGRYWDSNTCTCECLETSVCSTGAYFDTANCRCMRRR